MHKFVSLAERQSSVGGFCGSRELHGHSENIGVNKNVANFYTDHQINQIIFIGDKSR